MCKLLTFLIFAPLALLAYRPSRDPRYFNRLHAGIS